jgi:hypothetical protein
MTTKQWKPRPNETVWIPMQEVPGNNARWAPRPVLIKSVGTMSVHLANGYRDAEIRYCYRTARSCARRCSGLGYIFTGQTKKRKRKAL